MGAAEMYDIRWAKHLVELREELGGTSSAPALYTWAGKGWGGAQVVGGQPEGLDCSGFSLGLLRRLGLYPHGSRAAQLNSQGLHDAAVVVGEEDTEPYDLIFFGDGATGIYHVAVVLIPGHLYVDAGGGGSRTRPGGSDWPPRTGRSFRFRPWAARASERVSVGRLRGAVTAEDREVIDEWEQHVAAVRRGDRPALSERLVQRKYRPMWSGYGGAA